MENVYRYRMIDIDRVNAEAFAAVNRDREQDEDEMVIDSKYLDILLGIRSLADPKNFVYSETNEEIAEKLGVTVADVQGAIKVGEDEWCVCWTGIIRSNGTPGEEMIQFKPWLPIDDAAFAIEDNKFTSFRHMDEDEY